MTITRGTRTSPSEGSYENVSPGVAQAAPDGLLEDVSPPEEEIEFVAEEEPPPLVDPPESEDDDDDDASADDDASRASSTFTLPDPGVDQGAMVDLSDPARVCLVRMGRRVDGKTVPCVCGRAHPGCTRRSHEAKREEGGPTHLGEPGFYVRLEESGDPN